MNEDEREIETSLTYLSMAEPSYKAPTKSLSMEASICLCHIYVPYVLHVLYCT